MGHDPDILVELTKTATDFDAEVIAGALQAAGIPATVFARATSMLQGQVSPVPAIVVSVRRADRERAAEVLAQIRKDAMEIDWSKVDTQDESPVTAAELARGLEGNCAACGYDRRGLKGKAQCPECGASTEESPSRLVVLPSRRRTIARAAIWLVVLVMVFGVVAGVLQLF